MNWRKENPKYAHLCSQKISQTVTLLFLSLSQNSKMKCVCKCCWQQQVLARLWEGYQVWKFQTQCQILTWFKLEIILVRSTRLTLHTTSRFGHKSGSNCPVVQTTLSEYGIQTCQGCRLVGHIRAWSSLHQENPQGKAGMGWPCSRTAVWSKLLSKEWSPIFPMHRNHAG